MWRQQLDPTSSVQVVAPGKFVAIRAQFRPILPIERRQAENQYHRQNTKFKYNSIYSYSPIDRKLSREMQSIHYQKLSHLHVSFNTYDVINNQGNFLNVEQF